MRSRREESYLQLSQANINDIRDFANFLKRPEVGQGQAWQWCDEQMQVSEMDALGIVPGIDYLHFVDPVARKQLPYNRVVQTAMYDYMDAQHAISFHNSYPEPLSINDLRKRTNRVLSMAADGHNFKENP